MAVKKLRFEKMLELGGKNYRAENIKEVNPTCEGPVVAIELFYMTAANASLPIFGSHSWGWTVMRLDTEGCEYGEADHYCQKFDAVERANNMAQDTHLLNYDSCDASTWKKITIKRFCHFKTETLGQKKKLIWNLKTEYAL